MRRCVWGLCGEQCREAFASGGHKGPPPSPKRSEQGTGATHQGPRRFSTPARPPGWGPCLGEPARRDACTWWRDSVSGQAQAAKQGFVTQPATQLRGSHEAPSALTYATTFVSNVCLKVASGLPGAGATAAEAIASTLDALMAKDETSRQNSRSAQRDYDLHASYDNHMRKFTATGALHPYTRGSEISMWCFAQWPEPKRDTKKQRNVELETVQKYLVTVCLRLQPELAS